MGWRKYVKHMWEQVKRAMIVSAREVCGSVRGSKENPDSVWWNDEVKAVVRRKEAAFNEALGARDEKAKEK